MKPQFYAYIFLSGLLLSVSSCADHSKSVAKEAVKEQQLQDGQIINIMMTVDKGEIATAQEAIKKGLSPSVEVYAKYLLEQHQQNLQELTTLAQQLQLEPKDSIISHTLSIDGEAGLEGLKALQSTALDKAFIDAMVKGHQDGLKLIDTTLLPQAKNPQLKAAVEQFRSMVAEHLEKGRALQST